MTVGQLASLGGVRPDTIRYYERAGLLPVPQRTGGDQRRYGAADVDRLLFIRGAQRLGLRLAQIRELLAVRDTGVCACESAESLLRCYVAEIGTELARLAELRSELLRMLAALPGPAPRARCRERGVLPAFKSGIEPGKEAGAMCPCCDDPRCGGSCCGGEVAELALRVPQAAPGGTTG